MQRRRIPLVLQDAIIGFVPAAFLAMTLMVVGLPLVMLRHSEAQQTHWGLLFLELILMTSGFIPVALLITTERSVPNRWRVVISGVGAVFLLALLSAFLQGAHLGTIIVSSILAGMFSALGTWGPRVRNRELPERGSTNLTLYLTLVACTVTGILLTLARYVSVARVAKSHGIELHPLERLDYAIVVSLAPALMVLLLARVGWLSTSWKRTVPVYALFFILILMIQFVVAIIRGG